MQKEIVFDQWAIVETRNGTEILPSDLVGTAPTIDDLELWVDGEVLSYEVKRGWGARLTMPGYLDCSEWTIHNTAIDADTYLTNEYFSE